MSRAVVVLWFALFAGCVAGNLIRNDDVTSKDVKIQRDDISSANDVTYNGEALVDVEAPAEVFETDPPKKCVEIGQFCINHSECCTNACLGYLKRCVSG